jgi:hypothetical protein
MDLGDIIGGFKELVRAIVGQGETLPAVGEEIPVAVDGDEQAATFAPVESGANVKVALLRSVKIGRDELRESYDEENEEHTRNWYGNRVLTFNISCVRDDETDDGTAIPLLENIRSRLENDTAKDALRPLGLSHCESGAIENNPLVVDDRAVSAAHFQLSVNAAVSYEDVPVPTILIVNAEYEEPE